MCSWVFTWNKKIKWCTHNQLLRRSVDHRKCVPSSHISLPVAYLGFKNHLPAVCGSKRDWLLSVNKNKVLKEKNNILCISEGIPSWWWCVAWDTDLDTWALSIAANYPWSAAHASASPKEKGLLTMRWLLLREEWHKSCPNKKCSA